jgi:hypothetical protein
VDHTFLLLWHAFLISLFFAFLWRTKPKERAFFFLKTFLIMVLGGVLVGWLMYPFP